MRQFFIDRINTDGKAIISDKRQLRHLRDVLRLKKGKEAVLVDNNGNSFLARLKGCAEEEAEFQLIKKIEAGSPNKIELVIACAIPKKAKFEDIVDKLTQLGVDKIIPLETERVIVKLGPEKKALRLMRWQRISREAAKQSQRSRLPVVEEVQRLEQFLAKDNGACLKLIPHLSGKRRSLKETLLQNKAKKIIALVGPEGDFTPGEVELAEKAGFIPVSLGPLVLRVDTAAIAVASFIRLHEDS